MLHVFCHAVLNDVWNYFLNAIFVLVRFRRLSILSHRLVLRNDDIVSIDIMTVVDDWCSSCTINANFIFGFIFEYRQGVVTYRNGLAWN